MIVQKIRFSAQDGHRTRPLREWPDFTPGPGCQSGSQWAGIKNRQLTGEEQRTYQPWVRVHCGLPD